MTSIKKGHIDWYILLVVASLMLMSSVFVSSASAGVVSNTNAYLFKHLFRVGVGFFIMIWFSQIDYHFWQRHSKKIMLASALVLLIVLIITR